MTLALLVACGGPEYQPPEVTSIEHELITLEVGGDGRRETKKVDPEDLDPDVSSTRPTTGGTAQPSSEETPQQNDVRPDSDQDVAPKTLDELQAYDLSRRVTGGKDTSEQANCATDVTTDATLDIGAVIFAGGRVELLSADEIEEKLGPVEIWSPENGDIATESVREEAKEDLSSVVVREPITATNVIEPTEDFTADEGRIFIVGEQWRVYVTGQQLVVTKVQPLDG